MTKPVTVHVVTRGDFEEYEVVMNYRSYTGMYLPVLSNKPGDEYETDILIQ